MKATTTSALGPSPFLSYMHDVYEKHGEMNEAAIQELHQRSGKPKAELWALVTFYHHFRHPRNNIRICNGPICRLNGSEKLLEKGGDAMACAGMCDRPIPILEGDQLRVGDQVNPASPLPPAIDNHPQECLFEHIREPNRSKLSGYGQYPALAKALEMGPEKIIETLHESGLAGRGGAGFPTGKKWEFVARETRGPKAIVCNADEGEPGCFKDRLLMEHDPHALLEGMLIGALATGAEKAIIYLRYEYPTILKILTEAIAEAKAAGLMGQNILGSDFSMEIVIRRGAGAYICGEEGSLLNSLEGKHPFPRNRPPFPVTHGLDDLPTAVNNVETLAAVPPILNKGGAWYKNLGIENHAGTKIISLSGDIRKPGNYEIPIGLPLKTLLYDWAGGPLEGQEIMACTMAGLSGGFLAGDDLNTTLDEPALRSRGSFLGAGGVMVFDKRRDPIALAHMGMEFFAEESCGKCFPCRIGTQRLTERLAGNAGPKDLDAWLGEVNDLCQTMKSTSACGLGVASPLIVESLLRYFPERVAEHVRSQS